jgi:hypothetical protein
MSEEAEIINIIPTIAAELGVDESFIEKDWYAMQVIRALSHIEDSALKLVFSGGTSLSKGFNLIERFSEDLDFKAHIVGNLPSSENQRKKQRSDFRDKILACLETQQTNWQLDKEKLEIGNESRFFKIPICYEPHFQLSETLRPHVQLEVTFGPPALAPKTKSLQSFVSQALKQKPEVINSPCIDPVETAADKLSALVWRIKTRNRNSKKYDPTLVRHLHDLALLANLVKKSNDFPRLVKDCLSKDQNRGNQANAITEPKLAIKFLVETFETDSLYEQEYKQFVDGMSYAEDNKQLKFAKAIKILKRFKSLF